VACAVWDGGVVGRLVGSDRCHSLVVGSRCPVNRMLLANAMVTCLVVNSMVQPSSENWPIDRREGQASAWTMCTHRAARGSMGRSSSASCMEVITLPVGVAYHDGGMGGAFVDDRSSDGGEVGSATSVGDSNVWLGKITDGGTYGINVWQQGSY
jgi:hypothetical protein